MDPSRVMVTWRDSFDSETWHHRQRERNKRCLLEWRWHNNSRSQTIHHLGELSWSGSWWWLPSGKHTKNYGKSPCLMGKLTISMTIFNSYVKLPEGKLGMMSYFILFCIDDHHIDMLHLMLATLTCDIFAMLIYTVWMFALYVKKNTQKHKGCLSKPKSCQ